MASTSTNEFTIVAADPIGNLIAALKYTFSDWQQISQWVFSCGFLFALLLISTEPTYAYEMFVAGVGYWGTALLSLFRLLIKSETIIGLFAIGLYTLTGGVVLQHVYSKLRRLRLDSGTGLLTVLPGVIAAGCASCGAGVLSLLVGIGALASLPLVGVAIRFIGIILFVHYLSLEGNPTVCQTN